MAVNISREFGREKEKIKIFLSDRGKFYVLTP